jgi:hypothetical protein
MPRKPLTDAQRARSAELQRIRYRQERGLPEDAVLRVIKPIEERDAHKKEMKRLHDLKYNAAKAGLTVEQYLQRKADRIAEMARTKAAKDEERRKAKQLRDKAAHRAKIRIVECQPKPAPPPKEVKTPQQIEAELIMKRRAEMKRLPGAISRGFRVRYLA